MKKYLSKLHAHAFVEDGETFSDEEDLVNFIIDKLWKQKQKISDLKSELWLEAKPGRREAYAPENLPQEEK